MNIKNIVLALWVILPGVFATTAEMPKEQPKDRVREIMVEGDKEITKIQGQIVAVKDLKVKEGATSPLPTEILPTPIEESKPSDVVQLIKDKFGKDWEMALKIADCESGLTPDAIGDNYPIKGQVIPSVGVFQIRLLPERGLTEEEMKNPEHNVEYAKMLFDKSGWTPWSCFRKVR